MLVETQQRYINNRKQEIQTRQDLVNALEFDLINAMAAVDNLKSELKDSQDMLEVEQMALTAYKIANNIED